MLGASKMAPRPGTLQPKVTSSESILPTNKNLPTLNHSELEAQEILKYIKDAYQIPKLISATDLINEDTQLKKIGAKKVPSLILNSQVETLSRGESKFTTQVSNTNLAYKKKLARRNSNMKRGFFSKQGQPYASVGEVYTNNAALLQSTLMTDVINKMKYKANNDLSGLSIDSILSQSAGTQVGPNGEQMIDVAKAGISQISRGQSRQGNRRTDSRRMNRTIQSIIGSVDGEASPLSSTQGPRSARPEGPQDTDCTEVNPRDNDNVQKAQNDESVKVQQIKSNIPQQTPTNRKRDSGMKQIKQKLSYTNKMRTDVSGGIDLLTSLDEVQYKEQFNYDCNNENEEFLNDDDCASEVSRIQSTRSQNLPAPGKSGIAGSTGIGRRGANCQKKKKIKGPKGSAVGKSSKSHPEPWNRKNIKTRKQMIKEIAENQMTQLVHETDCSEANKRFSATYANDSEGGQGTQSGGSTGREGAPAGGRLRGLAAKQRSAWTKVRTIGMLVNATRTVAGNSERSESEAASEQAEAIDRDITAKVKYLSTVNNLLSALYNMKKNSVKSPEPLSELEVKELLNSDIEIDAEGRPKPKISKKRLTQVLENNKFDNRKTSIANLLASGNRTSKLGKMGINKKFKDLIKTSKIMKDQKVATWDDLLNVDVSTGQIHPPSSPLRAIRDKEVSSFIPNETIYDNVINKYNIKSIKPIWLRSDRHGFDLDKQYLLGEDFSGLSSKTKGKNDSSKLNKTDTKHEKTQRMRIEFDKTKAALSKDLHLELEYRRQQQALLIRNKLLSLKLGPISSVSLEKMRRDAHKMVKDQQLLTPLKTPAWFLKLERLYGKRSERLAGSLHDIGRFQRYPVSGVCDTSKLTSGHDIQHNKMCYLKALDKLCLIMASLPAYEVLEENCSKAFEFIIREILGFPENVYSHWVKLRQLRSGSLLE